MSVLDGGAHTNNRGRGVSAESWAGAGGGNAEILTQVLVWVLNH